MCFKFITNASVGELYRPDRETDYNALTIFTTMRRSSCNGRFPLPPPSVDPSESLETPKSPPDISTGRDFDCSTPLSSRSEYHSKLVSSSASPANGRHSSPNISAAWRQIFDDYFKSDDECDVLSPDDEWWLRRSKRLIETNEPPSGKTRLPRRKTSHRSISSFQSSPDSSLVSHSCSDLGLGSKDESSVNSEGHPQTTPPIEPLNSQKLFAESPCPITDPPTQTDLNTISADTSKVYPGPSSPDAAISRNCPSQPRTKESASPNPSRLMAAPPFLLSDDSVFPPLNSSTPAKAHSSQSFSPLICGFSSECQPPTGNHASVSDPSVPSQKKLMSRLLAESHEKSLRESLPAFRIYAPAFIPNTIAICPSDQRPVSELPGLIHSICNDGISLPSGKTSLEGGPYLAVAFDMEWPSSRVEERENRTAVLQLSSRSKTLIIQISSIRSWRLDGLLPQCLIEFLINPQIVKVGVGIRHDGLKLLRDHKLGPKPYLNSFLEISRLAGLLGDAPFSSGYTRLMSLQQIVATYLKVYLPKIDTRVTDWTQPLDSDLVKYAASNVIATLRVTQRLFELFEGAKKSKPSLLILDFIESSEPDFDRTRSSKVPVIPSSKEWRTIQPKPFETEQNLNLAQLKHSHVSEDVNKRDPKARQSSQNVCHQHKKPQHLGELIRTRFKQGRQEDRYLRYHNLKRSVSFSTQKAWELWYHKGFSVNRCSKAMKVNPLKFGVLIGKMLVHFRLNHKTLDDYCLEKIKTSRSYKPRGRGTGQDPIRNEQSPLVGLDESVEITADLNDGAENGNFDGGSKSLMPKDKSPNQPKLVSLDHDKPELAGKALSFATGSRPEPNETVIAKGENELDVDHSLEARNLKSNIVKPTAAATILTIEFNETKFQRFVHELKVDDNLQAKDLELNAANPVEDALDAAPEPEVDSNQVVNRMGEDELNINSKSDHGCRLSVELEKQDSDHRPTLASKKPTTSAFDWWQDVEGMIEPVGGCLSFSNTQPDHIDEVELAEQLFKTVSADQQVAPTHVQGPSLIPQNGEDIEKPGMDEDQKGDRSQKQAAKNDESIEVNQELVEVMESSTISDGLEIVQDKENEVNSTGKGVVKTIQTKNIMIDVHDPNLTTERLIEVNQLKLSLLKELIIGLKVDNSLQLTLSDFGLA